MTGCLLGELEIFVVNICGIDHDHNDRGDRGDGEKLTTLVAAQSSLPTVEIWFAGRINPLLPGTCKDEYDEGWI